MQKFNGKLEITERLEKAIIKKFTDEPELNVIPVFSATSNIIKSELSAIIGFVDRKFRFYRVCYSDEWVYFKSIPTIQLDGLFMKHGEEFLDLIEVRESNSPWSKSVISDTNKVVYIDSTFIMGKRDELNIVISLLDNHPVEYHRSSDDNRIEVRVINVSDNNLPKYETVGAAGLDVMANIKESVTLNPGKRVLVPAGIKIELPPNTAADARPKSGLALKKGITVLNTPGLIDEDFRGEVGIILINHGEEDFVINPGDRIAQLTFSKVLKVEWNEVKELSDTERGEGGFGSTDNKTVNAECDCTPDCKCTCK